MIRKGHIAIRRTFFRLRDKYYWPTMLRDVKEYCTCEPCALGRRVHSSKAYLNPTSKALVERISLHHSPLKAIITYRGSNFISELFSALCKALNINRMKTTACHPQTNG
ncbi:Uncharacterized protein APZ42_033160 [Daphnia magna]|uniref:RNA-directed DNA polymerase n=1 Tax=Daphnia magna TaxID=35525 RepID=A0A164LCJ1_9CRUS|nr:Uncharacterized protein APZ42_033160 [Daphnia magna]